MDKPPNTIYLINEGDYYSWCEDPAPGIGMEEVDAVRYMKMPVTVAKGLKMPRTVEHYQANAIRDQELILEQKDEIGRLNRRINKLAQRNIKMRKRNG